MVQHMGGEPTGGLAAAPAIQGTKHDDQDCGDTIPRNDSPWIRGLNIADDPMPGKHDPQHDQRGNYEASFARRFLRDHTLATFSRSYEKQMRYATASRGTASRKNAQEHMDRKHLVVWEFPC